MNFNDLENQIKNFIGGAGNAIQNFTRPVGNDVQGIAQRVGDFVNQQNYNPQNPFADQNPLGMVKNFTTGLVPATGQTLLGLAQGIARIPGNTMATLNNQTLNPSDLGVVGKTIFGNEPMKPYQVQGQELAQNLFKSKNPLLGAGLAMGSMGLDFSNALIPEDDVAKIAASKDVGEIGNLLKGKVADEIIPNLANKLKDITNPAEVKSVIADAQKAISPLIQEARYKPQKLGDKRIFDVSNKPYVQTKDGWGDAFLQMKGTPPKKYGPSFNKVNVSLDELAANTDKKIMPIYQGDWNIDYGTNRGQKLIKFDDGTHIQKRYFDKILREYPNAEFYKSDDSLKVAVKVNGKIMAVTMPVQDAKMINPIKINLQKLQSQPLQEGNIAKVKSFVPQQMTKPEAQDLAQNLGLKPKPEIPTGETPLGLTETIKESEQSTPEMKSVIQGGYDILGNKETLSAAQSRIAKDAGTAYDFAKNTHNAEANATAILLAKQYEAAGQPERAAELMIQKAQQALEAGQGNQIYAMWNKLSPETVGQTAAKTIEQYNQTAKTKIPALTGEQYQYFVNKAKEVQAMVDGRGKDIATNNLLKEIGKLIPSSTGDKIFALWRTGLLTGFRTPGKILLSHGISSGAETVNKIPATIIDRIAGLFTGERSVTPTLRGNLEGAYQGMLDAVDNMVHGYNAPNTSGFQRDFTTGTHFSNKWYGKIAQAYTDYIGRLHSSLYKPFFGAAHINSLFDQAMTEAANQGLKGTEAENFVENFIKNPPTRMAEKAIEEAKYITFQNRTKLGEMMGSIQKRGGVLGKGTVPFSQIPSSIIMRLVDYSPAGAVKTIIDNIGKGNFDQRAFSMGLGRSIMGTGAMAVGAALFNKGLMTLGYPTNKAEQAIWRAEGKIENAVKIGDKWHQLTSLGALGDVLATGGNVVAGMQQNGLTGALAQGAAGAGQAITNTPYFTSAENLMNAVKDPSGYALGAMKSFGGSVLPTGIGNIATATDPLSRQTNSVGDTLISKIPGLRESLLPQKDVFGQDIPRSQGAIGSLFDPTYASTDRSTPVTNELERLIQGGNSVDISPILKNQTIYGQKVQLNPQQLTQVIQTLGPQELQAITSVMQSPIYQSLNDTQKSSALSTAISGIKGNEFQKMQILQGQQVNQQTKKGQPTNPPITINGTTIPTQTTPTDAKQLNIQKKMFKDAFDNSGGTFQMIDGQGNDVGNDMGKAQWILSQDQNTLQSRIETKDQYQYRLNEKTLTDQKDMGDTDGWMQTAQQQMHYLINEIKDPKLDPLTKMTAKDSLNTLAKEYLKYSSYGGFSRGRKLSLAKPPKPTGLKFKEIKAPKTSKPKEIKPLKIALPKSKPLTIKTSKAPAPIKAPVLKMS